MCHPGNGRTLSILTRLAGGLAWNRATVDGLGEFAMSGRELEVVSQFAFRIPHLPDFVLDHSLVSKHVDQRLVEHARRWTQFVAGLWSYRALDSDTDAAAGGDSGAIYALRFESRANSRDIDITFVGADKSYQETDFTRDGVLQSLSAFGVPLEPIVPPSPDSRQQYLRGTLFEVRQADRVVPTRMGRYSQSVHSVRGTADTYFVSPWWGPGGPFLAPMRTLSSFRQHSVMMLVLLKPTHLTPIEMKYVANVAARGMSAASAPKEADATGQDLLHQADPQSSFIGRIYSAHLRRLEYPFHCAVYCLSEDRLAAKSVAMSLVAMINEEMPFEVPLGLDTPSESRAVAHPFSEEDTPAAIDSIFRLQFPRQNQPVLRDYFGGQRNVSTEEKQGSQRLRYLMDARGAASVFRLPVSIQGGVPGVEVRQRPPDFHPGPKRHTTPEDHILLGEYFASGVASSHDLATVPVDAFTKHCLVTGFTGSGKTQTVLGLLHQFWNKFDIPFLVIESAKSEYRGFLNVKRWRRRNKLQVFTLGNSTGVPFRLNPFELQEGVRLELHLGRLMTCFEAAMPQMPWLPSILAEALEGIYADFGWSMSSVGPSADSPLQFPTLTHLMAKVPEVVTRRGYHGEVCQNVLAATQGRIKTLLLGSTGQMLNCSRSMRLDKLFLDPTVLELNDLNELNKSLITMFILVFLREFRELNQNRDGLTHVTVVEEAHNVLERASGRGSAEIGTDTKAKAVEAFCNMLAEVRAYGEGLIIADQSPSKLAPDALRNTNVQIAHQLRDANDREAIANAMIMTDEQRDFLGKLAPGWAAMFCTGLERATFVEMHQYYDRSPRKSEGLLGEGFSDVSEEALRCHAFGERDLTTVEPRPYKECAYCEEPCRHREAVHRVLDDPLLVRSFEHWYHLVFLADTKPPPDEPRAKLLALVERGTDACGSKSASAALCYYINMMRTHRAKSIPCEDLQMFVNWWKNREADSAYRAIQQPTDG